MSSTNKTAKLELSQFLGTDKPAWLGDYNSDMQKIDDAFADLEQGGQSSAVDIAALQQKDVELEQSITDVNDRVDTVSADLITVGNRTTVLEGNYDTMHHELVLINEEVNTVKEDVAEHQDFINHTRHTEVYINSSAGSDDNDGTAAAPFKTIEGALKKYHIGGLDIKLMSGNYVLPLEMRSPTYINIAPVDSNQTPIIKLEKDLIIANKIRISKGVTIDIDTNATFDVNAVVLAGKMSVNAGCKLIISSASVTIGQTAEITGDGTLEAVRCMFYHITGTKVDIANLSYIMSLIFDKGCTITSNVTNINSIQTSVILA